MSPATPTYSAGTMRGVAYNELDDSMRFEIAGGTAVGIRRFRVAWSDRFNFLSAVFGEVDWVRGELRRLGGAQRFPGYGILEAQEYSIEGEGRIENASGEISFTSAIVTVKYMPAAYNKEKDEQEKVLSTEEMDFAGEFMLAPEGNLKWGAYFWNRRAQQGAANPQAGKAVQQQMHVLVPTVDYIYTKKNVIELPKTAIQDCLGKVNSGAWPPTAKNRQQIAPGYLLFMGGTARRMYTSEGQQPYELTLVFKYRMPKWNQVYHGADATHPWADTDPVLYESADFTPLFKFTQGSS
jgi:hypothetical protein